MLGVGTGSPTSIIGQQEGLESTHSPCSFAGYHLPTTFLGLIKWTDRSEMKELVCQPGVGRERLLAFIRRAIAFQNEAFAIAYAGDCSIFAFRHGSHSTKLKPRYQITTVDETPKLGIVRIDNFNQILLVFEQPTSDEEKMIALTAYLPQDRKH